MDPQYFPFGKLTPFRKTFPNLLLVCFVDLCTPVPHIIWYCSELYGAHNLDNERMWKGTKVTNHILHAETSSQLISHLILKIILRDKHY